MSQRTPARGDAKTVRVPVPQQTINDRYQLLERLGMGGMGLVFLAEQLGVGNKVAIKVLDPEPQTDQTRIQRFLREGEMALTVSHPGAAQLLDYGQDKSGFLYLVFEYVDGKDLRELLREEGRLGFEEARTIAVRVAEVLAFAHTRGIVHRDIKPENIRIRRDLAGPHVKVLDFGIARLIHDQGIRLTAEGELAGTPRYMAPEQIRDAAIDARTDVYALGLVFFETLCGRPAFDGKNMSHVLLKQVQEPMPALRSVVPELNSPSVDGFLQKACAKRPDDRFQTMEAFVRALMAVEDPSWPSPRLRTAVPLGSTKLEEAISDTYVRPPASELAADPVAPTEVALGPPPARSPTISARRRPSAPGPVPWDTSSGKKMLDEADARAIVRAQLGAVDARATIKDEPETMPPQPPPGPSVPSDLLPTDPHRPAVPRRSSSEKVARPPSEPERPAGQRTPGVIPDAPPVGPMTVMNDSSIARPRPRRRIWPWLLIVLIGGLGGALAAWQADALPQQLVRWLSLGP